MWCSFFLCFDFGAPFTCCVTCWLVLRKTLSFFTFFMFQQFHPTLWTRSHQQIYQFRKERMRRWFVEPQDILRHALRGDVRTTILFTWRRSAATETLTEVSCHRTMFFPFFIANLTSHDKLTFLRQGKEIEGEKSSLTRAIQNKWYKFSVRQTTTAYKTVCERPAWKFNINKNWTQLRTYRHHQIIFMLW